MNKRKQIYKHLEFNAIEREKEKLQPEQENISNSNNILTLEQKQLIHVDGLIESHILTAQLYQELLKEEFRIIDSLIRTRTKFYDSNFNGFDNQGVY